MAVVRAGKAVAVPCGVRWALDGELTPGCRAICWNPEFAIQCVDTPEWRRKGGGDVYRAMITADRVLAAAGVTGERPAEGALVVAWCFGGRIDQVAVVPVRRPPEPLGGPLAVRVNLSLRRGTETGAPVALFWREGGMVPLSAALALTLHADVLGAAALGREDQHKVAAGTREGSVRLLLESVARIATLESMTMLLAKVPSDAPEIRDAAIAAAACGRREIVALLVAHAARDERERTFRSALFAALTYGHRETAESVHHAALEAKVKIAGAEVAELAADLGMVELARALGSSKPRGRGVDRWVDEIAAHAGAGHEAMVRAFLDAGVVKGDERLGAALVGAAASGSTALVDALVKAGADPRAADGSGPLALTLAVQHGYAATARRLLEAGADADTKANGRYPLVRFALQSDDAAMLELLVAHGAKTEVDSGDGVPLLHLALSLRAARCVAILAGAGSRIDVRSENADALIEDVVALDQAELLARALDDGWPIERATRSGCRVAEAASWMGAWACRDLLAKRGTAGFAMRSAVRARAGTELSPFALVLPAELAGAKPQHLVVRGIVDSDGRFCVPVVEGYPDLFVGLAVVTAARDWRFTISSEGGEAGPIWCELPIEGVGREYVVPLEDVEGAPVFLGPYTHIARQPAERATLVSGSLGGRATRTVTISDPDTHPALLSANEARLAALAEIEEAQRTRMAAEYARHHGATAVVITVDRDGRVGDVRALGRPGNATADSACSRAKTLRFLPATREGRFVQTRLIKRIITEP